MSKQSGMIIEDITVTEENLMAELHDPKSKLHEYAQMAKELGVDLSVFVPKHIKHNVKFTIKNTTSAFANAIRRGLCSEYLCTSMICDFTAIKTDDKYVKVDELQTALEGIPFSQDIGVDRNLEISIDYHNDSSIPKWLHSGDIVVYDKESKRELDGLFEDTIRLVMIQPGCKIFVPITLAKGRGEENGNRYKPCNMWSYKDLDNSPNKHILSYECSAFEIGYQTYGNCKNPYHLLIEIAKDFIARITKLHNIISEYKSTESNIGDVIHFTMTDVAKYNILDETSAITNLYATYCRAIIPDVYVVSGCDHPTQKMVFVKIRHNSPHDIMIEAGQKILSDFNMFLNKFNKLH